MNTYNLAETGFARFFILRFRKHFKCSGDVESSLFSAMEDSKREMTFYRSFAEKNPYLPRPDDIDARISLADRLKEALSEKARKEGCRIMRDKLVEDIRLVSLEKNLFEKDESSFIVSPTKNNVSVAAGVGNNIIEMKFGNDDCMNPSFLEEFLRDMGTIRLIMKKYEAKLSIHSKWKSLRWSSERWHKAKRYN